MYWNCNLKKKWTKLWLSLMASLHDWDCLAFLFDTRREGTEKEGKLLLRSFVMICRVHDQWSKNTRMMIHQRIRDHRFLWCAMSWVILSDPGSLIHLNTPKEHAHRSRRVLNSFQKSSICLKLNKQVKYVPKSWKLITKYSLNSFRQRGPHCAEEIWKRSFNSTVKPVSHTNPSRKWENLKKLAFRFRVGGRHCENGASRKRWLHDNLVISLTEFSSNKNPKLPLILRFQIPFT